MESTLSLSFCFLQPLSSDSNHDPAHYGQMGQLQGAGVCHWTCLVEWNRHLRERASAGRNEIRGRLHMEAWAHKQLASERRVDRELDPWDGRQERAKREKREWMGSKQVLVLEMLDRLT